MTDQTRLTLGVALLIFSVFLFLAPGHLHPVDEMMRFFSAESLLLHGKTNIPEPYAEMVMRGKNGEVQSPWLPGQMLAFTPFVALGHLLPGAEDHPAGVIGREGSSAGPQGWAASYLNVIVMALTVGFLMDLFLRLGFSHRESMATIFLYVFGTQAGPMARLLYIDPLVALSVTAATVFWVRWCRNQGDKFTWYLFGIAVSLAYAVLCRMESILLLSPFAIVPLAAIIRGKKRYWRLFIFAGLGLALGFVLDLSYNQWRYGNPLETGYLMRDQVTFEVPFFFGLARILTSPSKGLLFLSPFLAAGFLGLKEFYRRDKDLFLLTVSVSVLYLGFFSLQLYGAESVWGIRHVNPILPLLMIPTVLGLLHLKRRSRLSKRLLILLLGVSIISQLPALFVDMGTVSVYWTFVNSIWGPAVSIHYLVERGSDLFLLWGWPDHSERVIGILGLSFISGGLSCLLLRRGLKAS